MVGCLETIQELPRDLAGDIEECFAEVIPPRNAGEAAALASAGEEVLRRLPDDITRLSPARAEATVRVCWLINGPEALERLSRYAGDSRFDVQQELVTAWDYFDPEEYARRVLAAAPLIPGSYGGFASVSNPRVFPHLRYLRGLKDLRVDFDGEDLGFLRDVRPLRSLRFFRLTGPGALSVLECHPALKWLWVRFRKDSAASPWPPMPPALLEASVFHDVPVSGIGFLDRFHMVEELSLNRLDEVTDFTPLTLLTGLKTLNLLDCRGLSDPSVFGRLPGLVSLHLTRPALGGLDDLVGNCPNVRRIGLRRVSWLEDITPLASLALEEVRLSMCANLADLTPLSELGELRRVGIRGCDVRDLSALGPLQKLKRVDLAELPGVIDVAPLAGKPGLVIEIDDGQELRNTDLLDPTARIRRL